LLNRVTVADIVAEEDRDRAALYALLGECLQAAPSQEWLSRVSRITGGDGPVGAALTEVAGAAGATSAAAVAREYHDRFIGLGRGEFVPYASYYLTGFLNEKPLAVLRQAMAELGIERDPAVKEPEDHIAALCQMMAGLITGAFGSPLTLAEQKRFFAAHVGNWASYFFRDLARSPQQGFYPVIGRLGEAFLGVEEQAFAMVE